MDAAARSVRAMSHDISSRTPYYLSHRPDRKYPSFHHHHKRFEEWEIPDLQYLTFLSDADRGVLLTRPEYDMREEPKPASREPDAPLKPSSEKKKMTLSDYKNKKSTGPTSTSPPEPLLARKKESDRASGSPAIVAAPRSETKRAPDAHRVDNPSKLRDADSSLDVKPHRQHDSVVDTRLPPKPPSKGLPPKPPTPDGRKRLADADGESRPVKRSKPDDRDRTHPYRDDTPRKRDKDVTSIRESSARKDSKAASTAAAAPSSLPNGRSIVKTATSSTSHSATPVPRSRGNSVNGVRPGTTSSGSIRGTASKPDGPSKTSVPPLLSPLNLNIDGNADDVSSKADWRRRDETAETQRLSKPKLSETPTSGKKNKPPVEIPALLSPTLPPEVEAELERRSKATVTSADRKAKNDKLSIIKKQRTRSDEDDDEDDDIPKSYRKSLIVKLKIPKKSRQSVRRILALPPRKDGHHHERSISSEVVQPALAKKRPANTAETPSITTSAKRPRTSDAYASSKLPAPATPSKKSTTMSRVSSSNSLAPTPGEPSHMGTISAGDRLANGYSSSKLNRLDGAALKEKSESLGGIARRLKREADTNMNAYHDALKGQDRSKESSLKLGCLLTLESITAFMVSFYAQDLHRASLSKPADVDAWSSIFKFLDSRRNELKRFPSLFSILLLLRATADEQFLNGHSTHGNPDPKLSVQTALQHQRYRNRALTQLRNTCDSIEDPDLRPAILPWATVDEIADMSLRIMKRWSFDERIEWQPEVNLR